MNRLVERHRCDRYLLKLNNLQLSSNFSTKLWPDPRRVFNLHSCALLTIKAFEEIALYFTPEYDLWRRGFLEHITEL